METTRAQEAAPRDVAITKANCPRRTSERRLGIFMALQGSARPGEPMGSHYKRSLPVLFQVVVATAGVLESPGIRRHAFHAQVSREHGSCSLLTWPVRSLSVIKSSRIGAR